MKKLLSQIKGLKDSEIGTLVDKKLSEFRSMQKKNNKSLFNELCFCILTANWQAEGGIRIQEEMKHEFCSFSQHKLAKRLRGLGYRFPNVRAGFIAEAQKHKDDIKTILKKFADPVELREWIVKNIKGLGYKEASHFLRNIGYENLAIIDFHIINLLVDNNLIQRPKTLTPKRYLEIEEVLKNIGKKADLSMAELDLYLWYIETGKILK